MKNGVDNPGEYLGITATGDFDGIIGGLNDGSLAIALHVQSFSGNGGGMSFVNSGSLAIYLA